MENKAIENKAAEIRTIKCGLARICPDEDKRDDLIDKVERASLITYEACKLINLYLLIYLRDSCNKIGVPFRMHEITGTFIDKSFALVSCMKRAESKKSNMDPNPELKAAIDRLKTVFDKEYKGCRHKGFNISFKDNLAHICLSAREKLLTNAKLHVRMNFEHRTHVWIRFQIFEFLCQFNLDRKVKSKLIWQLVYLLYNKGMNLIPDDEIKENDAKINKWFLSVNIDENITNSFINFVTQICDKMKNCRLSWKFLSPTIANLDENWYSYFPWLYFILCDFEKWHREYTKLYDTEKNKKNERYDQGEHIKEIKEEELKEKPKQGKKQLVFADLNKSNNSNRILKGVKMFTLFPECKIRPMYIDLSNTVVNAWHTQWFKENKKISAKEAKKRAKEEEEKKRAAMTKEQRKKYDAEQKELKKKAKKQKAEAKKQKKKEVAERKRVRLEKKAKKKEEKDAKESKDQKAPKTRKRRRTKEEMKKAKELEEEKKKASQAKKAITNANSHDMWSDMFDLDNFPRNSGKPGKFAYSISTDGLAVSIHIYKHNISSGDNNKSSNRSKKRKINDENIFTPIDLTGKRVIGLDPGRRDLFTTVDNDNCQIVQCSNREWRKISGAKNRSLIQKGWIKNAGLQKIIDGVPTSRTADPEVYKYHLSYVLTNLHRIMNFHSHKRQKKLRWNTQQKRMKAMDNLCKRITQSQATNKDNVVVAYGSAGFSSVSAGHAPTPNKEFRRRLARYCTIVDVDEYLTSQICSSCDNRCLVAPEHLQVKLRPNRLKPNGTRRVFCKRLAKVKYGKTINNEHDYCMVNISSEECKRNGLKEDDTESKESDTENNTETKGRVEEATITPIHGVRICPICRIQWNRDVNAALNILHVFLYMNSNEGKRPLSMRRPEKDEVQHETKLSLSSVPSLSSSMPTPSSLLSTLSSAKTRKYKSEVDENVVKKKRKIDS